jgi:adenosylcobinamide-phosphate synthase
MTHALYVLLAALALECLLGEVPSRVHPVVWMGKLTSWLLRFEPKRSLGQLGFGAGLCLLVAAVFVGGYCVVQRSLAAYVWLQGLVDALVLNSTFAVRGLWQAGQRMRRALEQSLPAARQQLSHLCSRDPSELSREELIGASVESLAENTCDSFVAPLLYYCAFGIAGALCYRVVNTLDAMIGYRGRYEYTGKFAARLDDALNLIPARLSAALLVIASALLGYAPVRAFTTAWAEHTKTPSPNAGWTMAAMAGALGVRLDKRHEYNLGQALAPLVPNTLRQAQHLVLVVFALCFLGVSSALFFAGDRLPFVTGSLQGSPAAALFSAEPAP